MISTHTERRYYDYVVSLFKKKLRKNDSIFFRFKDTIVNKCCVENIVSFNIDHQNFEREKSHTNSMAQ